MKRILILLVILMFCSVLMASSAGRIDVMVGADYDSDDNGLVDDSDKLGGQLPAYYAIKVDVGLSTAAIKTLLDAVIISTGAIQVTLDAVILSTGTLVKKIGSDYIYTSSDTHTVGDSVVEGNINLGAFLYHYGDTNTFLRFSGDDILLTAGGLSIINGVESTTDTIYIGDGAWGYIVIGDTSTGVNLATFTFVNGRLDLPGDVYCHDVYTSSGSIYVGDIKIYQNTSDCMGVDGGICVISTTTIAGQLHLSTGTAPSPTANAIVIYPVGNTLRYKETSGSGGTERTILNSTQGMDRTVYDSDTDNHADSINTYATRAYKSSADQVVVSTAITKITFNTETFDKGSNFTHHTSSSVYYVPKAGLYRAMAQLHWTAAAKDEDFKALLIVNETIQAASCAQSAKAASICTRVHDILSLSANDEVWVSGKQTTGNDRYVIFGSSWTFFTINYIGND